MMCVTIITSIQIYGYFYHIYAPNFSQIMLCHVLKAFIYLLSLKYFSCISVWKSTEMINHCSYKIKISPTCNCLGCNISCNAEYYLIIRTANYAKIMGSINQIFGHLFQVV